MIAGLEETTAGAIKIDGVEVQEKNRRSVVALWFSRTMRFIHI